MNHGGSKEPQPQFFIISEVINKKDQVNETVPQSP